jgi:hypothetical protein
MLALWVVGLGACADGASRRSAHAETTRASMQEITDALRVALPLAFSEERYADPANHDRLLAALAGLAENANDLESHGISRDASFEFLSRSLARDAREVHWRFQAGRVDESRFLLGQLVEDCIACHSRLPSESSSSLGKSLLADVDVQSLSPLERVRLEIASRQFDLALDDCEQIFRGPLDQPLALDLDSLLRDYLVVALRVENDLTRPRATLRELAARGDLAPNLREDLMRWVEAMDSLAAHPPLGSDLEQARALVAEAERRNVVPADRGGLVHDIAASGHLYRFLDEAPAASPDVAEAYYLLGKTDARIRRSFWLSESDFYLETAIRMAPGSDLARRSYALLEEQTVISYSGSSGENVPEPVLRHLEEMRRLAGAGAAPRD